MPYFRNLDALFHLLDSQAADLKTRWILISWLLQKPTDLDLPCFTEDIYQDSTEQNIGPNLNPNCLT